MEFLQTTVKKLILENYNQILKEINQEDLAALAKGREGVDDEDSQILSGLGSLIKIYTETLYAFRALSNAAITPDSTNKDLQKAMVRTFGKRTNNEDYTRNVSVFREIIDLYSKYKDYDAFKEIIKDLSKDVKEAYQLAQRISQLAHYISPSSAIGQEERKKATNAFYKFKTRFVEIFNKVRQDRYEVRTFMSMGKDSRLEDELEFGNRSEIFSDPHKKALVQQRKEQLDDINEKVEQIPDMLSFGNEQAIEDVMKAAVAFMQKIRFGDNIKPFVKNLQDFRNTKDTDPVVDFYKNFRESSLQKELKDALIDTSVEIDIQSGDTEDEIQARAEEFAENPEFGLKERPVPIDQLSDDDYLELLKRKYEAEGEPTTGPDRTKPHAIPKKVDKTVGWNDPYLPYDKGELPVKSAGIPSRMKNREATKKGVSPQSRYVDALKQRRNREPEEQIAPFRSKKELARGNSDWQLADDSPLKNPKPDAYLDDVKKPSRLRNLLRRLRRNKR